MQKRTNCPPAWLAVLAMIAPTTAMAGSVVTLETRDLSAAAEPPATVQITVDGGNLRLDPEVGVPDAGSMVFRGGRNEMIAIDHQRKQYVVLDEAAMQGMATQVSGAMQQMEQALAGLPPEQRAMAEQMMKQRMGGMAGMPEEKPQRSIQRTGESDSVNGVDCDVYTVSQDGRKTDEMCIADWSDVDGGEEVSKAMLQMAGFFENVRSMFARGGVDMFGSEGDVFSYLKDLDGFPIRSRRYESGTLIEETNLVSSEDTSVDPALFAAPDGYTQQSMPQ